MKNCKKMIFMLLLSIVMTPAVYAIDAAQAYQNALSIDQTNEDEAPVLMIDGCLRIIAEEAISTGNMKLVENILLFPVNNNKVLGLKYKHLREFQTFQPAYDFIYNHLNDTDLFNMKELCVTLTQWGDYNNALDIAENGCLWSYYFKVPHSSIYKIALGVVNDTSEPYSKRMEAALYIQREHNNSQYWFTLASNFIQSMPSSGLNIIDQRVKVSALETTFLTDPNYIVQNSHVLVNDEIKMIQMDILLFLDYQETQGHPDALTKLLYISENADNYDVRVTAKRIYNKHTN